MKLLKIKQILILLTAGFFLPLLSVAQLSLLPEMVLVDGGTFKMGNTSDAAYADEQPVHKVTLDSYFIGKYEVTVYQYQIFCTATGRNFPSEPSEDWYFEHEYTPKWSWKKDHPITNVSWFDAVEYCEWLSEKTGDKYRLPTEAEWEYAAKGGKKSKGYKYSGNDDPYEVSWFDETTDEAGTMAVGKKSPNELGLYDMSGNVWEWCSDKYAPYTAAPKKNPRVTSGQFTVVRGGSWYYVDEMSRVTARDGPKPVTTNFNYGFRVVKELK